MSATFVRLTVLADDSQLDVSLPAHRPVVEYIDDVLTLFGPETARNGSGWTLSSPTHGPIEIEDTLADYSVTDGTTLHLTSSIDAAQPPFVDDVIAEMRRKVDVDYRTWSGSTRAYWLTGAMAALAVWTTGVLVLRGPTAAAAAALAVLAVLALVGGGAARSKPAAHLAWLAVPAAGGAAWRAAHSLGLAESVSFTLGAAAVAAAIASVVVGRWRAFGLAAAGVGVATLIAGAVITFGANPTAVCVWASVVPVLALIVTPRSALASSGLLALVRKTENMELADRRELGVALDRGRLVVDAVVWGASALVVPMVLTIALTGFWEQGLVAAVLAVVLLLRSRSFTHARHVGPMVAAGTVSLLAVAYSIPRWIDSDNSTIAVVVWLVAAVLVLFGAGLGQAFELPDVGAARVRRLLDSIDLPLTLAYFPIVFFAQGIYGFFWPDR